MERLFQLRVAELLDPVALKKTVYDTVRAITELCDFYEPNRQVSDEIVDAFLQGRVT